jgi:hypothetical protein
MTLPLFYLAFYLLDVKDVGYVIVSLFISICFPVNCCTLHHRTTISLTIVRITSIVLEEPGQVTHYFRFKGVMVAYIYISVLV